MDSWQTDANKRLLSFVLTADRRGRDYAPDARYDATLRCIVNGPKTTHIADVLARWAGMWAQDMREAKAAGVEINAEDQWLTNMREADAEIDRYIAAEAARSAA